MFAERLLFIVMVAVFSLPAVVVVTIIPRLVLPTVLITAALYSSVAVAKLTIGSVPVTTLLLAFVGAIAVASLIVPKPLKVRTPLRDAWYSASRSLRLIIIVFTGMIFIATVNTLLRSDPAAGTAVAIAVWVIALAGGVRVLSCSSAPSALSRFFLLKSAMLVLVVSLLAICLVGGHGRIDVILSVLVLAVFALALTSRFSVNRFVFLVAVAGFISTSVFFFPGAQSLLGGVLFGAAWMYIVLFMQRTGKLVRNRKLLAIAVLASILVLPVTTILLHQGQQMPIIEEGISWALDAFGETMWNLMDRPARWEVLLAEIQRHPFNLRFTNFAGILYLQISGVWEVAAPHNILISIGIFFGIPGMIIAVILTVALISSLLRAIARSEPRIRPITLGAFGIVCGLLFRNMWSNALFTWPIEITLFSLAILAAWQVGKASPQTLKQAVSAELQSGPSKGQHFPGGTQ